MAMETPNSATWMYIRSRHWLVGFDLKRAMIPPAQPRRGNMKAEKYTYINTIWYDTIWYDIIWYDMI